MRYDNPLKAEDVAQILQIGKNSVYRLAQSGELSSYRIGRKLRFTTEGVNAYLAALSSGETPSSSPASTQDTHHTSTPASCSPTSNSSTFVLAGNDMIGDVFANYLNIAGFSTTRSYVGSYTALVALYQQQADVALLHLYDRETNTYNIPYVQRVAPGLSVVVVRLFKRQQGLIVADNNPLRLSTWGSLLRENVRLANRERGCGTRILLDEKILALEARAENIEGYEHEFTSAYALARFIAQGGADVGIGTERCAHYMSHLTFIPLQTEWVDLVVVKNSRTQSLVQHLKQLAASPAFKQEAATIQSCDTAHMGSIIYEC